MVSQRTIAVNAVVGLVVPFISNVFDRAAMSRKSVDNTGLRVSCRQTVRFVGFWTAVLLPFVLVTLLASGAIVELPVVAGGILAVNLAGLVFGRKYKK